MKIKQRILKEKRQWNIVPGRISVSESERERARGTSFGRNEVFVSKFKSPFYIKVSRRYFDAKTCSTPTRS